MDNIILSHFNQKEDFLIFFSTKNFKFTNYFYIKKNPYHLIDDLVIDYNPFSIYFFNDVLFINNGITINGKKEGYWIYNTYIEKYVEIGFYKNGKKDGYWKELKIFDINDEYFNKGFGNYSNIISEGFYKNGQKEGFWFFVDNIKKAGGKYINNLENNYWFYSYNNKLSSEGFYDHGDRIGLWFWFHLNTDIFSQIAFYKNNKIYDMKEYSRTGKEISNVIGAVKH